MNAQAETKTYFGESLDEVLPQIRTELGPDALIVRQREGVLGGIGGFFGRKCIEVDARPAVMPKMSAMPRQAVVDAYDSPPEQFERFDSFEPMLPNWAPAPDPEPAAAREPARPTNGLEAMLAQSSPFAATLSSALAAEPAAAQPAAPIVTETVPPAAPVMPVVEDQMTVLREELLSSAVSPKITEEILSEARLALRPFDPETPMRELVRRALIRRIPIVRPSSSERCTIAVIGVAGVGRTLATASLCAAYSQAGRTVASMSLEPALDAIRLAGLLRDLDIQFDVASTPDVVSLIRAGLDEAEVIVADVPPLLDSLDAGRLMKTLALLEAFRPDETHLVLPAYMSAADAKRIVDALASHALPTRMIISHTDDVHQSGAAVGLAVTHRIPVSFVSCGPALGRLRPAEAEPLSKMVLR